MTTISKLSAREFLEDTYRPRGSRVPEEELMTLPNPMKEFLDAAEQARRKEARAQRMYAWAFVIGMTAVAAVLIFLNIHEHATMTDAQRETLSRIIN